MSSLAATNTGIRSLAAILLASTATVAPALAQPAAATPAAEQQSEGLAEIIVTAQKRAENLQDVPISVQAFDQAVLENAGIVRAEDLPALVSGMSFARAGGGAVTFIRGIGAIDTAAGQEAPVATFVDGVYRQSHYTNNMGLKNVERIEILKGPQGTLFGRNTTGGVIHIITRDPASEPMGEMSFSVGNYRTFEFNSYVTTPVAEDFAASLTGHVRRQEKGYGKNILTGNPNAYRHEKTVHTKWVYSTDTTKVAVSGDYSDVDDPRGFNREVLPGFISSGGSTYNGEFHDTQHTVDNYINNKSYGGALQIDQALGGIDLVSISAIRRDKSRFSFDNDLSPAPITIGRLKYYTKQYTQELRLSGEFGSGSTWILGAFYLHSKAGPSVDVLAGPTRFLAASFRSQITTDSYAAFGELGWQLGERDRLTVGGRYTIDKRKAFGTIAGAETAISGDKSTWKEPTWRVVYDHHFTDDVMAYASYNRGFKSGNYNTIPLAQPAYDPEIVDAFEVGTKMDLMDRRLRINLAGFYYKYKDLQVRIIRTPNTFTLNAGKAEIKGLEAEVMAKISDMLTLSASGTYLDAKYKEFPEAQQFVPLADVKGPDGRCPGASPTSPVPRGGNCNAIIDASGNQMIRAPKWTGNIGGNLTIPSSIGEITATARLSYNDGFPWDPSGRIREDSYILLNMGLGWESPSDAWGIRLSAENVTGTKYAIYGGSVAEADYYSSGTPRTYSITFEARF